MSDPSLSTAVTETEAAAPITPNYGSLASGVAVTFLTRLIILGCVLGSTVLVARWLGPEGTGALAVLNVTAAPCLPTGGARRSFAAPSVLPRGRQRLAAGFV